MREILKNSIAAIFLSEASNNKLKEMLTSFLSISRESFYQMKKVRIK